METRAWRACRAVHSWRCPKAWAKSLKGLRQVRLDCRESPAAARAAGLVAVTRARGPRRAADTRRRTAPLRDPKAEVSRDTARQLQQRAVLRYKPVCVRRVREARGTSGRRGSLHCGSGYGLRVGRGRLDQRRQARHRGERRRLVDRAFRELRVVEHIRQFGETACVDQRIERAAFKRGADRTRVAGRRTRGCRSIRSNRARRGALGARQGKPGIRYIRYNRDFRL